MLGGTLFYAGGHGGTSFMPGGMAALEGELPSRIRGPPARAKAKYGHGIAYDVVVEVPRTSVV